MESLVPILHWITKFTFPSIDGYCCRGIGKKFLTSQVYSPVSYIVALDIVSVLFVVDS